MCLILVAYRCLPGVPLVVAANRDEFHARASAPAAWWKDSPGVFAGRDLEAGGTWLGVSRGGRFSAVTNWTRGSPSDQPSASRGELPRRFLESRESAVDFSNSVDGPSYAGFNLVAYDGRALVYSSNRANRIIELDPGVHAISNAGLLSPGVRAEAGSSALKDSLVSLSVQSLLQLLEEGRECRRPDRSTVSEDRSDPGLFLSGERYGTRASTAVIFGEDFIDFGEQVFCPLGVRGDATSVRLNIEPNPSPRALAGT